MKKYLLGLLVVYAMYLQTGCGGGSSSTSQTLQPLAITSSTPPSGTTGTAYAGNGFAPPGPVDPENQRQADFFCGKAGARVVYCKILRHKF